MAEEKKYDTYGFKINNETTSQGNSDFKKYLKIFIWIMVIILILVNIFTSGLAGYLSFYEFQSDTTFIRIMKTFLAICLSWFYLGWKGLQKMGVM
jgi:hypothetical protein